MIFQYENLKCQIKVICDNSECYFERDLISFKDSSYQFYTILGKDTLLYSNGEINNNFKQGKWLFFNEGKNPFKETFYLNGIKQGVEKIWYKSGKTEKYNYYLNGKILLSLGFYENGYLESESIYNITTKKLSVNRNYYPSGNRQFEYIFPQDSSYIEYNYIDCYESYSDGIAFLLDENQYYFGNEWYDNGNKKTECKFIRWNPYTLEIIQYDSLEKIKVRGKIEHLKKNDGECWHKTGTWLYFKQNGSLLKKEDYQ